MARKLKITEHSGREIGRTAGGLQVSDRVGRTGGREADHGFAAKKA